MWPPRPICCPKSITTKVPFSNRSRIERSLLVICASPLALIASSSWATRAPAIEPRLHLEQLLGRAVHVHFDRDFEPEFQCIDLSGRNGS